jgi:hypothetical protein
MLTNAASESVSNTSIEAEDMRLTSAEQPDRPFDLRFAAALSCIFLAAALFNVWHHAMWRDEIRTWQVAVASPSLADLWTNMRHEGVPALWYVLVWGLTKIASSPFAMQVMHVLIATATVFVVSAAAPFPRAVRSIFAFGYFPFFEYATISRNYSLVFLGVMLAVAIIARPRPRPLSLAIVCLVLTQVSIWGGGFALLLICTAGFRWTWRREPRTPIPFGRWTIAFVMVIAGILFGAWSAMPPPDPIFIEKFPEGTPMLERLSLTFATIWKGWLPLPMIKRTFWNSNVLDAVPMVEGLAGVVLFVIAILAMWNRPVAVALLLVGSAGLMAFTYTQFRGFTRHHGHLFMVLIAAAWLAAVTPAISARPAWIPRFAERLVRVRGRLLVALLAIGLLSGICANVAGFVLPFSMSKATANYLRDNALESSTALVGYNYFALAPISGYLGRPIYYPQTRTWAYYGTQAYGELYKVSPQELLLQAAMIADETHKDVILIIDEVPYLPPRSVTQVVIPPAGDQPQKIYSITRLPVFSDSTEGIERYVLYRLRRVPS